MENFTPLRLLDDAKTVLIVDDEDINRDLLGFILEEKYDLLYASNGREALDILDENSEVVSLILLDVMMPVMNGVEFLKIIKDNEKYKRIPVIVLTSEKQFEIDTLKIGAQDFITKPFDIPEVIIARINRVIELAESTSIIQVTEFDRLTKLINSEYFYEYCNRYDKHHPEVETDCICLNIVAFKIFNELYGRTLGDQLLHDLAIIVRHYVREVGGVATRKNNDQFFLYIPHQLDHKALLNHFMKELSLTKEYKSVNLRLGFYQKSDKTLDILSRFDMARFACDAIKKNYNVFINEYTDEMHQKVLLNERLVGEIDDAIKNEEFLVYFQPKYSITGDKPRLTSAEALVRWRHHELGMISPGVFIPLFENNGLITKLDKYVWKHTSMYLNKWKHEYKKIVPISVNVSRIDLFDPHLIDNLNDIVKDHGLNHGDLYLEITESGYTENALHVVQIIEKLRDNGFKIEMDDFGQGYSSLHTLAELPIDVIKLDMQFIRNIMKGEKNIYILKVIIELKNYLNVPLVAEGVETIEQYKLLKELGCDIVQGYYFSAPVPASQFEKFLEELNANN